jgi:hypothetical protein
VTVDEIRRIGFEANTMRFENNGKECVTLTEIRRIGFEANTRRFENNGKECVKMDQIRRIGFEYLLTLLYPTACRDRLSFIFVDLLVHTGKDLIFLIISVFLWY